MWCYLTFERCTSPSSSSPPTPRIFRLFRRLIRSVWLCFFIRGGWGLDVMVHTPDREVEIDVGKQGVRGSFVGSNTLNWEKRVQKKLWKKWKIHFEFSYYYTVFLCYYPLFWRGYLYAAQAGRGIYQSTNNPLGDLTYATQLHNAGRANTSNP